jgi:hypothetical protein
MTSSTPVDPWIEKLREAIKRADQMGQSRGPNRFAMNERATRRLVDLQIELEAELGTRTQLLRDIARWRKCTSMPRKIQEFGSLAAWESFCADLWARFDQSIEGTKASV